jgi:hypothetical protein
MESAGCAALNGSFDLLLLVCDEGWPADTVWEHLRYRLDKARLTRVDEAGPGDDPVA